MMIIPFNAAASTFSIAVTSTASTSKAIGDATNIRIVNTSYVPVYISVGSGSQTATVPTTTAAQTCTPIPAQGDLTLSIVQLGKDIEISAICDTDNTATIIVSYGDGV